MERKHTNTEPMDVNARKGEARYNNYGSRLEFYDRASSNFPLPAGMAEPKHHAQAHINFRIWSCGRVTAFIFALDEAYIIPFLRKMT